MGTEHKLLHRDGVYLVLGEHSCRFDLEFYLPTETSGPLREHRSVHIEKLTCEELEELIMRMLDVLSYHAPREQVEGFIDRLKERTPEYG